MVTDRDLATALMVVEQLEIAAKTHYLASQDDLPERDASLVVARQAGALKGPLERWMTARALRAQLHT